MECFPRGDKYIVLSTGQLLLRDHQIRIVQCCIWKKKNKKQPQKQQQYYYKDTDPCESYISIESLKLDDRYNGWMDGIVVTDSERRRDKYNAAVQEITSTLNQYNEMKNETSPVREEESDDEELAATTICAEATTKLREEEFTASKICEGATTTLQLDRNNDNTTEETVTNVREEEMVGRRSKKRRRSVKPTSQNNHPAMICSPKENEVDDQ
jgi:hypothetical protein